MLYVVEKEKWGRRRLKIEGSAIMSLQLVSLTGLGKLPQAHEPTMGQPEQKVFWESIWGSRRDGIIQLEIGP